MRTHRVPNSFDVVLFIVVKNILCCFNFTMKHVFKCFLFFNVCYIYFFATFICNQNHYTS